MAHPASISAASGRAETAARRLRVAGPNQNVPTVPEGEVLAADAPGSASPPEDAGSNTGLAELGGQFAGLTRLLEEIYTVGETLPSADVGAMLAPVSKVLTGVMDRIIGAPAATLADLGLKAQVVMWAKRDWWEGDAQLGWQDGATKIFLEQTIAAAGLGAVAGGSS